MVRSEGLCPSGDCRSCAVLSPPVFVEDDLNPKQSEDERRSATWIQSEHGHSVSSTAADATSYLPSFVKLLRLIAIVVLPDRYRAPFLPDSVAKLFPVTEPRNLRVIRCPESSAMRAPFWPGLRVVTARRARIEY